MACGDALSWFLAPRRSSPGVPLNPSSTQKLLLLRLDGIGDNVCSWPALKLLRKKLPHTHIALAAGPWSAQLYRECPWLDEIIVWDSGLFGMFRGKGIKGLRTDIDFSRVLRARKFEAGIDLRGDILSITPLWMVRPDARIAQASRGGKRLLTDYLLDHEGHESQRTYNVTRFALGLPAASVPRPTDWPRPLALERAMARLESGGWDRSLPSAALCPSALWQWKRWPKERFQELAQQLKREHGVQIIWFLEHAASSGEYNRNDHVFCGPLDEVAAALGLCRLAVSNDSGLMHLAVAAGCGTVQLFGPGDASRFAHSGAGIALLHDSSCPFYPCTQRGDCANISGGGWCLERISVAQVYAACSRMLKV